jgi:hypothetical protein
LFDIRMVTMTGGKSTANAMNCKKHGIRRRKPVPGRLGGTFATPQRGGGIAV